MPRGSKPGERRGGREKGIPNKATIERAIIAEQVVARAEMTGRKLAKEVLDDFMQLFAGMAAMYQPLPPGAPTPPGRAPDESKFEKYATLAVGTATQLAKYQSPTFRAVMVAPAPPTSKGAVRKRFTLGIFDNQGRPAPKHIDVASAVPATATKQ